MDKPKTDSREGVSCFFESFTATCSEGEGEVRRLQSDNSPQLAPSLQYLWNKTALENKMCMKEIDNYQGKELVTVPYSCITTMKTNKLTVVVEKR